MTGTSPIDDPTYDDAQQALERLQLNTAERNRLMKTVRNYVRVHGPIEGSGLYADNRQTAGTMWNPQLVAEGCEVRDVPRGYLISLMSKAELDKLMRSEYGEYIESEFGDDPDGGLIPYAGKAEIKAHTKPPSDTHNVVQPGKAPKATGGDPGEIERDEE